MTTFVFLIALVVGAIILVGKDSASHRILKLVLSKNQWREYKKLYIIPGYAIYYLRKWAKEVKAREAAEKAEGESDERNT
jgi:hypothetical protein